MSIVIDRPSMKMVDHSEHAMPNSDFDGYVINPDAPNVGSFSNNTERFTRDKNESYPNRKYEKNM